MVDCVKLAGKVIIDMKADYGALPTTSQIRKFLTAVNTVSGKIEQYKRKFPGKILEDKLQMQVKFLKVKLAYQIGRADTKWNDKAHAKINLVKEFEKKADLMNKIDAIGDSVEKYDDFARYVEALVAFHKFYGGREK